MRRTWYENKIVNNGLQNSVDVRISVKSSGVQNTPSIHWITELRITATSSAPEVPGAMVALGEWNHLPTWEDMLWLIGGKLPWSPDVVEELTAMAMLQFGLPFADDPSIVTIDAEGIRLLFRSTEFLNDGDHHVEFVCLEDHDNGFFSLLGRERLEVDIKWKVLQISQSLTDNFQISELQAIALAQELMGRLISLALPNHTN